ncbi:hypothetical protein RRG08_020327 [Elysia crispata]|uniref:Uncharacterized protein n=1 Tax=Elysia crispata TaxID=231223 RepID=A0AAE1AY29_9GAST|nr:hypothetical protein RRG08_020327 [Elysia crispata]
MDMRSKCGKDHLTAAASLRKDITHHSSWPCQTARQQPQSSVKTSHTTNPDPTPNSAAAAAPRDDIPTSKTPAPALTLTVTCPDTPRRRLQPPKQRRVPNSSAVAETLILQAFVQFALL